MDARNVTVLAPNARTSERQEADFTLDLDWVLGIAKRQWKVVAAIVLIFAAIGVAYVLTATPLYKASADVLIDRANSAVVNELSTIGGVVDDDASVLSQVELLKSSTISVGTVTRLKLDEDPVFMASDKSITVTLRDFVRSLLNVSQWFVADTPSERDRTEIRRIASEKVQGGMDIRRVGKTYALSIEFVSPSPDLAARVVNGIAESYLADKLDSKYEATRRASLWLQDRIAELRDRALESDLAVQKFRTANGLVSTGTQLVSDQQLAELNSALIAAQADVAAKRARYERIQLIISSGQMDAIVTDVLASSISNDLRSKYLTAAKRADELTAILGPAHESVIRQRNQMNDYRKQMFDELRRISESYRSDVDVAEAREKSLAESVTRATDVSAVANETKVQLRELERASENYRNLYQNFLQKYQESVQQQSFPVTDARIISPAVVPKIPAFPRKTLVLALFIILGGAAGCGLGLFREYRDRFFRTGEQVRDELGLEMLGVVPLVQLGKATHSQVKSQENSPDTSLKKSSEIYNYVIDRPLSSFAEAMRSIKFAADLALPSSRGKVIGVISTIPGEGKSTIAINLAELLASHGARAVLIDADLRNPGATRAIGQTAENGLIEVLLNKVPLRDALLTNKKTNLEFLPAVMKQRLPHSSEILSSLAMRNLLDQISADADYVIVDLPPLAPVVDARAMAGNIDAFVCVTEWGGVARRMVRQTLENEPQVVEKCLGVILNKVDMERMKLYRTFGSNEHYYSSYSSYYRES
jgi:succinoglycan biosynthesis transport protein ExoP